MNASWNDDLAIVRGNMGAETKNSKQSIVE